MKFGQVGARLPLKDGPVVDVEHLDREALLMLLAGVVHRANGGRWLVRDEDLRELVGMNVRFVPCIGKGSTSGRAWDVLVELDGRPQLVKSPEAEARPGKSWKVYVPESTMPVEFFSAYRTIQYVSDRLQTGLGVDKVEVTD